MKTYDCKKVKVMIDGVELKGYVTPELQVLPDEPKSKIVVTDKVLSKAEKLMSEKEISFKDALVLATDQICYLYADESEV